MTIQLGTTLRNNMLDQVESTTGTSAVLRIRTGAQPANCAASRTGTVLATLNLPSDWMANASGGTKAMSGTWEDSSADASGTAGYFEIMDSGLTTCHLQGSVTATGGGGDLTLDSVAITASQDIKITSFTLTAGNA